MALTRNAFPGKHFANEVYTITGRFAGGGAAANCTRVSNTGQGITSVNYNGATGAYIITFADVGPTLLQANVSVMGAALRHAQPAVYSASAKTLTVLVSDLATPTAQDLATNEELHIDVKFSNSSQPNG